MNWSQVLFEAGLLCLLGWYKQSLPGFRHRCCVVWKCTGILLQPIVQSEYYCCVDLSFRDIMARYPIGAISPHRAKPEARFLSWVHRKHPVVAITTPMTVAIAPAGRPISMAILPHILRIAPNHSKAILCALFFFTIWFLCSHYLIIARFLMSKSSDIRH